MIYRVMARDKLTGKMFADETELAMEDTQAALGGAFFIWQGERACTAFLLRFHKWHAP